MKRTFTYLLLLVLLVCGKQAYNLLISNEHNYNRRKYDYQEEKEETKKAAPL